MAEYSNISSAGQLPSVSLITDYISANMSDRQYDALCIDDPNTNNISRVYLIYGQSGTSLLHHGRIAVYWHNGYITRLSTMSGTGGNIDTSTTKCFDLDSYFTVYGASTSTGGGGGAADYTPYTEFWFPVVSIVAILFIFSLIYKIIIRRLLP